MPIVLKNSGMPADYAIGGFAAGMGGQREKAALDAAQAANARNMQQKAQDFNASQTDKEQVFRVQQADTAFQNSQTAAETADARQLQHQQSMVDYGYTAAQVNDHNKYVNSLYEIDKSPNLSDEEKGLMKNLVLAKKAGIQKLPRMLQNDGYPEGRKPGDIFEQGGFRYTVDQYGVPHQAGPSAGNLSPKDHSNAYAQAMKVAKALAPIDPKTGIQSAPTQADVDTQYQKILQGTQGGNPSMGGQPQSFGQPSGQPQAGNPAGAVPPVATQQPTAGAMLQGQPNSGTLAQGPLQMVPQQAAPPSSDGATEKQMVDDALYSLKQKFPNASAQEFGKMQQAAEEKVKSIISKDPNVLKTYKVFRTNSTGVQG